MNAATIKLKIKLNGKKISTKTLSLNESVPFYFGRATSDFRINYDFVSKVHCQLLLKNKKITLIDNHSANGTQVNEVKIDTTLIQTGDTITIGELSLFVEDIQFLEEPTKSILLKGTQSEIWLMKSGERLHLKFIKNLFLGIKKEGFFNFFDSFEFNFTTISSFVLILVSSLILSLVHTYQLDIKNLNYFLISWLEYFSGFLIFSFILFKAKKFTKGIGELRHYLSFTGMLTLVSGIILLLAVDIPVLGIIVEALLVFWFLVGIIRVFEMPPSKGMIFVMLTYFVTQIVVESISDYKKQYNPKLQEKLKKQKKENQKAEVLNIIKKSKTEEKPDRDAEAFLPE